MQTVDGTNELHLELQATRVRLNEQDKQLQTTRQRLADATRLNSSLRQKLEKSQHSLQAAEQAEQRVRNELQRRKETADARVHEERRLHRRVEQAEQRAGCAEVTIATLQDIMSALREAIAVAEERATIAEENAGPASKAEIKRLHWQLEEERRGTRQRDKEREAAMEAERSSLAAEHAAETAAHLARKRALKLSEQRKVALTADLAHAQRRAQAAETQLIETLWQEPTQASSPLPQPQRQPPRPTSVPVRKEETTGTTRRHLRRSMPKAHPLSVTLMQRVASNANLVDFPCNPRVSGGEPQTSVPEVVDPSEVNHMVSPVEQQVMQAESVANAERRARLALEEQLRALAGVATQRQLNRLHRDRSLPHSSRIQSDASNVADDDHVRHVHLATAHHGPPPTVPCVAPLGAPRTWLEEPNVEPVARNQACRQSVHQSVIDLATEPEVRIWSGRPGSPRAVSVVATHVDDLFVREHDHHAASNSSRQHRMDRN